MSPPLAPLTAEELDRWEYESHDAHGSIYHVIARLIAQVRELQRERNARLENGWAAVDDLADKLAAAEQALSERDAALAAARGEVERLRKVENHAVETFAAMGAVRESLEADLAAARERVGVLEAALETVRAEAGTDERVPMCRTFLSQPGPCTCEHAEHNAKVAAVLAKGRP